MVITSFMFRSHIYVICFFRVFNVVFVVGQSSAKLIVEVFHFFVQLLIDFSYH